MPTAAATRPTRRWSRLVAAGVMGVLGAAGASDRAAAQCEVVVDGTAADIRDADRPGDAIELPAGSTIEVTRPDDGTLVLLVWTGPVPVPVPVIGGAAGEAGSVDLDDVEWLGVGLYRVELIGPGAGECAGTSWFRVTGRSPFTTVAGISATVVTLAGIGLVTQAARRGRRQRCSIVRGVVGGVLAGAAGSFVLQQFGALPMLGPVIVLALVLPGLLGGLVARICCVHAASVRILTPLLAAPAVVRAGERFELRAGVVGAVKRRQRREPDEVTVQVVAAGAEVVEGESWRHTMVVRDGQAEASVPVQMRATRDLGETQLTAFYSAGGQTIGMARRPLWVIGPDELPPPDAARAARSVANTFQLPVEQPPVDLELRASFAGPRALNVLQFTAESPHRARLSIPDAPMTVDLGSEPELFAATLLADVTEGEGRTGLAELLLGTGRQLARTVDRSLMDVVREVFTVVGPRPPRVLLLTEDSAIPWELTAVEPAPASAPPFLATRAVVGRWFLAPGAPLPPPVTASSATRRVVATDALPAAGSESRRLQSEFGFQARPPTMAGVLDAFEESAVVHLACHGSWRVDQGRTFLQLDDGRLLPRHIAGLRLDAHPFVFLNACQVAAGGEALGTPTGFPAELVFAGAAGCVTPLWSVRDDQAYEIAVAFYRELMAGRPPAELIRELRLRAAAANLVSSTPFAYQYCGHPDLRIADAVPVARSA